MSKAFRRVQSFHWHWEIGLSAGLCLRGNITIKPCRLRKRLFLKKDKPYNIWRSGCSCRISHKHRGFSRTLETLKENINQKHAISLSQNLQVKRSVISPLNSPKWLYDWLVPNYVDYEEFKTHCYFVPPQGNGEFALLIPRTDIMLYISKVLNTIKSEQDLESVKGKEFSANPKPLIGFTLIYDWSWYTSVNTLAKET